MINREHDFRYTSITVTDFVTHYINRPDVKIELPDLKVSTSYKINGDLSNEVENLRPRQLGTVIERLIQINRDIPAKKVFADSIFKAYRLDSLLTHPVNTLKVQELLSDVISGSYTLETIYQLMEYAEASFRDTHHTDGESEWTTTEFQKAVLGTPNSSASYNVEECVLRTLAFLNDIDPHHKALYSLEMPYTEETALRGIIDCIAGNKLIDFKSSRLLPTACNTYQLLTYYFLLGHTHPELQSSIEFIGVFNPRHGKFFFQSTTEYGSALAVIEKEHRNLKLALNGRKHRYLDPIVELLQ